MQTKSEGRRMSSSQGKNNTKGSTSRLSPFRPAPERASSSPLPPNNKSNIRFNWAERGEEIVPRGSSPTMPRGIVGINTEAQIHRPVPFNKLPPYIQKRLQNENLAKRIKEQKAIPNSISIPVRNATPSKSCTVCGRRMRNKQTRRKRKF